MDMMILILVGMHASDIISDVQSANNMCTVFDQALCRTRNRNDKSHSGRNVHDLHTSSHLTTVNDFATNTVCILI